MMRAVAGRSSDTPPSVDWLGPVCSCRIQPDSRTTASISPSVTESHLARSSRIHCVPAPRPTRPLAK
jgi:hypothetical protein